MFSAMVLMAESSSHQECGDARPLWACFLVPNWQSFRHGEDVLEGQSIIKSSATIASSAGTTGSVATRAGVSTAHRLGQVGGNELLLLHEIMKVRPQCCNSGEFAADRSYLVEALVQFVGFRQQPFECLRKGVRYRLQRVFNKAKGAKMTHRADFTD